MRRLSFAVLITLLVGLLGGAAIATESPGSDPEGDTPGEPEVFHLYADANEEVEVYVTTDGGPPPGEEEAPTPGDVFIFQDLLYELDPDTNGPTGDQLGTNNGQCTFVRVDEEAFATDLLCHGVVTLPRGMISWQATATLAEEEGPIVIVLTGGSGVYADAGGRAIVRFVGDEGDSTYEVRLLHLALQP